MGERGVYSGHARGAAGCVGRRSWWCVRWGDVGGELRLGGELRKIDEESREPRCAKGRVSGQALVEGARDLGMKLHEQQRQRTNLEFSGSKRSTQHHRPSESQIRDPSLLNQDYSPSKLSSQLCAHGKTHTVAVAHKPDPSRHHPGFAFPTLRAPPTTRFFSASHTPAAPTAHSSGNPRQEKLPRHISKPQSKQSFQDALLEAVPR